MPNLLTTALAALRYPSAANNGAEFAEGVENLADDIDSRVFLAGDLKATARASAPTGWLLCDGAAISRTTYADLFDALGTTYGVGNGTTTFNLPDLRGRVPVGVDGAAGRLDSNDALGNSGGAKDHTLTHAEVPAGQAYQGGGGSGKRGSTLPDNTNPSSGDFYAHFFPYNFTGGGAHNNMQPYQVVNWLVKT